MKYGVVGSRQRQDQDSITAFINNLNPGDVVISGGCRGVDRWAVQAARSRGLSTVVITPDLTRCNQKWEFTRAYYARNEQIAQECDILAAFVSPDRKGGTENTIQHARKLGKPIIIL